MPAGPAVCASWTGGGGGGAYPVPGAGPPGPLPSRPGSGASPLSRAAMSGGRLAGVLACWSSDWPVTPLGISLLVGTWALGSAVGICVSFLLGVPPHPPWPQHPRPPWAHCAVFGRALRVARLRCLLSASPHGFGHLARLPAWAGFPCGLSVLACCHSPPPRRAVLPVSRPQDAGPPSEARGLACLPAGCRPGWWCAPGLGPGPCSVPGDRQMALQSAVLPVRLVGLGVDRVPVRPVPGLVDGTPGLICRVPLQPGDRRSRSGCGRGGACCRGVARAGRWWRQSGYMSVWGGRRTVCVWGSPSVELTGCGAVGALGWPVSGPMALGRLLTRWVVFGIVDPGRWRGSGLGPFVGVWCRGVARDGRLWLPYSCG